MKARKVGALTVSNGIPEIFAGFQPLQFAKAKLASGDKPELRVLVAFDTSQLVRFRPRHRGARRHPGFLSFGRRGLFLG